MATRAKFEKTLDRRPDLLDKYTFTDEEKEMLEKITGQIKERNQLNE